MSAALTPRQIVHLVAARQLAQAEAALAALDAGPAVRGPLYGRLGQAWYREEDTDRAAQAFLQAARCGTPVMSFQAVLLAAQAARGQGLEALASELEAQLEELNALVIPELRLVYLPIPKNGCTSIKTSLVTSLNLRQQWRESRRIIHRYVKERFPLPADPAAMELARREYAWVAVLRNPYKRLVSAYLNKVVGPYEHPKMAAHYPRIKRVQKAYAQPLDLARSLSFAEFVFGVAHTTDAEADEHWISQSCFVRSPPERFAVLGQLEKPASFDAGLLRLGVRLMPGEHNATRYLQGLAPGEAADWLPRQIKSLSGMPDARALYRDDLVALVAQRYAADIALHRRAFGVDPQPY